MKEILADYSKRLGLKDIKDNRQERQRMDWEGGLQQPKDKRIRRPR